MNITTASAILPGYPVDNPRQANVSFCHFAPRDFPEGSIRHYVATLAASFNIFAAPRRKASRLLVASSDNPTGTPPESAGGSETCGSRPIPAREVRKSALG